MRTLFLLLIYFAYGVFSQETDVYYYQTTPNPGEKWTEHPGGVVLSEKLVFSKIKSPYWLRNDIIIEKNAELIIESGVVIYVEPQVGITVRGVFTALVSFFSVYLVHIISFISHLNNYLCKIHNYS